ncbi:MAG TPA: hypothetical protein VGP96_10250 [Candidatus Dormibacteraeota bacterium]|jgi:hypothetical protein|nr:hypothetical protein [Candidatus Dormibacteraeota bacterium]
MVLMLVAELLGGETRVSPGGPIDTATAAADEVALWASPAVPQPSPEAETEIIGVRAGAAPARA